MVYVNKYESHWYILLLYKTFQLTLFVVLLLQIYILCKEYNYYIFLSTLKIKNVIVNKDNKSDKPDLWYKIECHNRNFM